MTRAKRYDIQEGLRNAAVNPDRLTFHKDGSITAKFGYFYRHGWTPEKYAARVKTAFPSATILEAFDEWRAWPRDSFFVVKFTI